MLATRPNSQLKLDEMKHLSELESPAVLRLTGTQLLTVVLSLTAETEIADNICGGMFPGPGARIKVEKLTLSRTRLSWISMRLVPLSQWLSCLSLSISFHLDQITTDFSKII